MDFLSPSHPSQPWPGSPALPHILSFRGPLPLSFLNSMSRLPFSGFCLPSPRLPSTTPPLPQTSLPSAPNSFPPKPFPLPPHPQCFTVSTHTPTSDLRRQPRFSPVPLASFPSYLWFLRASASGGSLLPPRPPGTPRPHFSSPRVPLSEIPPFLFRSFPPRGCIPPPLPSPPLRLSLPPRRSLPSPPPSCLPSSRPPPHPPLPRAVRDVRAPSQPHISLLLLLLPSVGQSVREESPRWRRRWREPRGL